MQSEFISALLPYSTSEVAWPSGEDVDSGSRGFGFQSRFGLPPPLPPGHVLRGGGLSA